ncbi:MAG: serine hydrolase domain-containing protein, partial [Gemmatimonadales bacterium]|nr:serine hydrolase domain-containing protein [Gemmatimonadales bacterium]
TVFHYSDTGYILLGAMIERLTGLTLGAAFRELLRFDRIGLTRTWLETIDPEPWFGGERAHQYLGAIDTRAHDPSFDLYGGGGLAAPVRDMAIFTRALMTGKVFAKPATLATMLERPAGVTAERDYRMGIYRRVVDGVEGFGHTGFWGTFSFHFPALDLTVAGVVTQQGRGQVLGRMLEDAVRAVRTASGSLGLTPSQD